MTTLKSIDVCRTYLDCQCRCAEDALQNKKKRLIQPFITISRETGAGGITVGEKLVRFLREKDKEATCPWTVFDKNLVQRALEEHDLPKTIEKYMAEDKISETQSFFEELFDLRPSEWTLVHRTSETILRLAQMGDVVLVGRGANVITRKLSPGFHVRLVGSLKKRVRHTQAYYHLGQEQAAEMIRKEDRGRAEYLKKHFNRVIDDPLLYNLVVNTDEISYEDTARMIGEQVLRIRKTVGFDE